jgi:putative transcriptional regulator
MITAGLLLIAPPKIVDPRFQKTVILICEHNRQGTLGVCLNRVLKARVRDLYMDLDPWLEDRELYWGGPVNTHVVTIVHPPEFRMTNTIRVTDTVSLTSNQQQFHRLQADPPQGFQIFTGLSMWAPGQLENEIRGQEPWTPKSSWLTLTPPEGWAPWDQDPELLWQQSVDQCAQAAVTAWM